MVRATDQPKFRRAVSIGKNPCILVRDLTILGSVKNHERATAHTLGCIERSNALEFATPARCRRWEHRIGNDPHVATVGEEPARFTPPIVEIGPRRHHGDASNLRVCTGRHDRERPTSGGAHDPNSATPLRTQLVDRATEVFYPPGHRELTARAAAATQTYGEHCPALFFGYTLGQCLIGPRWHARTLCRREAVTNHDAWLEWRWSFGPNEKTLESRLAGQTDLRERDPRSQLSLLATQSLLSL
jgi:hypothetical protein